MSSDSTLPAAAAAGAAAAIAVAAPPAANAAAQTTTSNQANNSAQQNGATDAQQQQGGSSPNSYLASSNKQLVEHAKNAIAQAQNELQQQQQQMQNGFQQRAEGAQPSTYQQILQSHLQPIQQQPQLGGSSNNSPYSLSPLTATPNDVSPTDVNQVMPFSPEAVQQRYATMASLQAQLQQQQQALQLSQQFHSQNLNGGAPPSPHSGFSTHTPTSPAGQNQAFAQVLVAGLPNALTQSELADIFSPLQSYERCGIACDPNSGLSIGRGWLVFSSTEAANQAIAKYNGIVVAGHMLHLSMMQPIGESTKSNIYVAGLPKQYNQSQLEHLFSTFGSIIESKILTDPSGQSRGVAFVRFDNSNSAAQAITAVNGHVMADGLHTYTIRVKFARDHHRNADPTIAMLTGQSSPNAPPQASGLGVHVPRSAAIYQSYIPPHIKARGEDITGGVALFVFHIPAEFTSRDLQELFAPCATVLSARIAVHQQTLESKGFGFVCVQTLEEAHQAVTLLNGRRVGRKFIKVSFKKQPSAHQTLGGGGQGQGQGQSNSYGGGQQHLGGHHSGMHQNMHQGGGGGGMGHVGRGGGQAHLGQHGLSGNNQLSPSHGLSGGQGPNSVDSLTSLAAALNLSNYTGSLSGAGGNGSQGGNQGQQGGQGGQNYGGGNGAAAWGATNGQSNTGSGVQTPSSPSLLYSQNNLHLLMQQMQLTNAFPAAVNGTNQASQSMYGAYSPSGAQQQQQQGSQQGGNNQAASWMPPSPISLPQSALNNPYSTNASSQQQQQQNNYYQ
jgi:RNA recognition motif-containing protein